MISYIPVSGSGWVTFGVTFVENLDEVKQVIATTWSELSRRISYAKGWSE